MCFIDLAVHPEKVSKKSRRSAFEKKLKLKGNDVSLRSLKDELLSTKVFLKYFNLSV